MRDIQNERDERNLPLDLVGITKLAQPLLIPNKNRGIQSVTGHVSFYADLPHYSRGHHMSRFIEILYKNRNKPLTPKRLRSIVLKAKKILNVKNAYLEISFSYFISKKSPVSGKNSLLDYDCKIISKINSDNYEQEFVVKVPVLLLCPCSKAISKHSAHNQRAIVTVTTYLSGELHIEDLIRLIEKEGSCEIYPLLKRSDEKYVTEKSYDNPKFVEDIVRDVALKLKNKFNIQSLIVECESSESIHNHNAYARYSSRKSLKEEVYVNS